MRRKNEFGTSENVDLLLMTQKNITKGSALTDMGEFMSCRIKWRILISMNPSERAIENQFPQGIRAEPEAMGAVPEAGGAVQPIPPTVNGNIPIYRAFRAKILIYYLLFLTLYCLIIRPFLDNIIIYVYCAV
ncbi:MAG: hypothetical protein J5802_03825 [Butyrivibrio sp.]|nr:hypothetical protein [Butyrivibrio sp.]